jgi:6-pyruvoyltetrahydropterin/6-carboxytetrahydropterin synthase
MTFQVGTSRNVRALHVMPGMEGPEGDLHPHDYRLDIVVEREALDERGMVCDLEVLDAALQEAAGRVEGQNLEAIRPEEAEAVTVEVFARWLHGELAEPVRMAGGERLTVRVFESDSAFGGYSASVV